MTNSTSGDQNLPTGMLSSPQIAYCADRYNIIKNYEESCLGPATYHMRIGGRVLTSFNGEKEEFELAQEFDSTKNTRRTFVLQPNSLTFITTIEEFKLTRDIIARFNLKSKWVHKGLLLGTGPIVDPEFEGRLLIPLHNFSSKSVRLNYSDKIISVEFTKTLDPDVSLELSPSLNRFSYIKNTSGKFNLDEFISRIGGDGAESSVLSQFNSFEKRVYQSEEKIRKFSTVSYIAFLAVVISLGTLAYGTWRIYDGARSQLDRAQIERTEFLLDRDEEIRKMKARIKALEGNLRACK